MSIKSFRDLDVWQRAKALAVQIYQLTDSFPASQKYTLSSQMQRAAVSVPSNIAEGQVRHATKDYIRFLNIALGSIAELETQTLIAKELGYIKCDVQDLINEYHIIGRMLNRLIASLSRTLPTKSLPLKPKAQTPEPALCN